MSENTTTKKKSGLDKVLDAIERGANKLPTPFTLFCILFAVTAIISLILGLTNVEMIHPSTGDVVTVNNFFTRDGVHKLACPSKCVRRNKVPCDLGAPQSISGAKTGCIFSILL